MALKPEFSIMGGLAVGSIVYAIHANATPTQADIRALPPNTQDIDKAERAATWLSVGVVAGISLLARDPGIFMIGSATAIGMAVWTRHSNGIESTAGRYLSPSEELTAGTESSGPQQADTEPYQIFAQDQFAR
jgi:hypothetical protein